MKKYYIKVAKLNKNNGILFSFKTFIMSESKDIIHKSSVKNLYRTINDRTLSEEYNSNSPITKERIKSMCGTSPTSKSDTLSKSRISEFGRLETNIKYMNSSIHERDVMAQYGIVSMDFHDKNKHYNITQTKEKNYEKNKDAEKCI